VSRGFRFFAKSGFVRDLVSSIFGTKWGDFALPLATFAYLAALLFLAAVIGGCATDATRPADVVEAPRLQDAPVSKPCIARADVPAIPARRPLAADADAEQEAVAVKLYVLELEGIIALQNGQLIACSK
jgi:hypothetical protein